MLPLTWLVQFQLSSIMSLTQLFLPHSQLDASALFSKGGDERDLDKYRSIIVGTVLFKLYATVLERRASVVGLKIMWLEQQGKLASDMTIACQTTSSL